MTIHTNPDATVAALSDSELHTVVDTVVDDFEAYRRDPVQAYCQWLFNELGLLNDELGSRSNGFFAPCGTVAQEFHYPTDGRSWKDVPPPSARAEMMLRTLGILPAAS